MDGFTGYDNGPTLAQIANAVYNTRGMDNYFGVPVDAIPAPNAGPLFKTDQNVLDASEAGLYLGGMMGYPFGGWPGSAVASALMSQALPLATFGELPVFDDIRNYYYSMPPAQREQSPLQYVVRPRYE